jgi:hypothetical protein
MFYAGVALAMYVPHPESSWGGRTLSTDQKELNQFIKQHGGILSHKITDHPLAQFGGSYAMLTPPNIPFPIPEEYQEELERRLTEEMTSEGYRPLTVKDDFIPDAYEDTPSNFDYAQGEYQEFIEEIEKGDLDEAYAEYSDVEGHVAYYLWTNHRIEMPVYTHSHFNKTLGRVSMFRTLFSRYGLDFDTEYLNEGSNYEKIFKVRKALDKASADQNKPAVTDTDEQIAAKIADVLAGIIKENPPPIGLEEDFENMKNAGQHIHSSGQDGKAWWGEQKAKIDAKYGTEALINATWLHPAKTSNFDPHDKSHDFIEGRVLPSHFINQIKRIPMLEPPTGRKILQVAYNIGQGKSAGSVTKDYTLSDFVDFAWGVDWSGKEPERTTLGDEVEWNPPKIITVSYVQQCDTTLFVFGDNDKRTGKGGQAVIRDEPNTIGIRTKKAPRSYLSAYYTDDEYAENIRKIGEDLDSIIKMAEDYDNVFFIPGIGRGLAKLHVKAPKTYKWAERKIRETWILVNDIVEATE